jgi:hypothetical protein
MYYTNLSGLTLATGALSTFTHGLGIAPANLVARPHLRNAGATVTAIINVADIGTNTVSFINGACGLTTFDCEVQQVHSILK